MKKQIRVCVTFLVALIITGILSLCYKDFYFIKSDDVVSFNTESTPENVIVNGYETNKKELICKTDDSWIDIPLHGEEANYVEIDLSKKAGKAVLIQVYYKQDTVYNETNSVKYMIQSIKKNRLYIPRNQYRGIRIDIGNAVGDTLSINRIKVGNESIDYIQKVGTLKLIITLVICLILLFLLEYVSALIVEVTGGWKTFLDIFNKHKKKIWYVIMWMGIGYYIFMGIKTQGSAILNTLHPFSDDTFMDFFNSMMYERHPYESKVIYPPIANLIYYVFYLFVPQDIFINGSLAIRDSQIGRLMIGIYISVTTLALGYAILKLKKGAIEEKVLFGMTLLLSMPFIYQLERANMIFLSLIFLMIYIYGYDSEKKYVKHIAFISLAISASIKIYPALFGLILIRDKRWKDALICCVYGIVIFLMPFMFFGGLKSVGLMIQNILNCATEMSSAGEGLKLNISNIFSYLGIILCNDKEAFHIISILMKVICLFGGICLILFANYKQKWKIFMVPTLMMILIPDFSFLYAMIFICIPLIYFLDCKDARKPIDICYFVLFILMLVPIVNRNFEFLNAFENDYYPLTMSIIIESLAALLFMIILWSEGVYSIIKKITSAYILQKLA